MRRAVRAAAVCDGFNQGGAGVEELARAVMKTVAENGASFRTLYPLELTVQEKMEIVAKKMYGASRVAYERKALASIKGIEKLGFNDLPICVAKTPASLSDIAELRGVPKDFTITVNEGEAVRRGRLIVLLCGSIVTMPDCACAAAN